MFVKYMWTGSSKDPLFGIVVTNVSKIHVDWVKEGTTCLVWVLPMCLCGLGEARQHVFDMAVTNASKTYVDWVKEGTICLVWV